MVLHVFVEVFFNGFVLMLGILNVMRGLYALGVCRRPQISTDHMRYISSDRLERQTQQTVRAMAREARLPNRAREARLPNRTFGQVKANSYKPFQSAIGKLASATHDSARSSAGT